MSAEELPYELLEMIFQHLKGAQAAACRAVCRHWRDAVDWLPDSLWERYCRNDFADSRAAQKISGLPYRELYKSLALWDIVEEAEVTIRMLPGYQSMGRIKILHNNVLAVPQLKRHPNPWSEIYIEEYNKIHYYDIKTMNSISCECFDLSFTSFDENDNLIVLKTFQDALWVVTKPNKKKFFVDHVNYSRCCYMLFATGLYFINQQGYLCMAVLKVVEGEEKIETEELSKLHDYVIAFAQASEKAVHVLTDDGSVLCFLGKDMKACIQTGLGASNVVNELRKFSFNWSNRSVLYNDLFSKLLRLPKKLESAVINCHSDIVLVGTSQDTVQIFKQPYKQNGGLKLFKVKPNTTIDVSQYGNKLNDGIQDLDVVEMMNGHRVICRKSYKELFFIDLLHNNTRKRSAHSSVSGTNTKKARIATEFTPPKVIVNKKATKKPKKVNGKSMLHGYNTRSKDKC